MKIFLLAVFAALATAQNLSSTTVDTNNPPPTTASAAIPTYMNDHNYLSARGDAVVKGVYVCAGPGWTNNCVWQRVNAGVCMGLPATPHIAFGPDVGIQCMVFPEKNCKGQGTSGLLVWPGEAKLNGIEGYDTVLSYICKPCAKEFSNCGMPWSSPGSWKTQQPFI